MRIVVVLYFTLAIGLSSAAQDQINLFSTKDSIEHVLSKLRNTNKFESFAIGAFGRHSMQYQGFLFLLNHITNDEFYALGSDSNTCIRLYAYYGLVYRKDKRARLIKSQLTTDSTKIFALFGCVGGDTYTYHLLDKHKWFSKKTIAFAYTNPGGHSVLVKRLFDN